MHAKSLQSCPALCDPMDCSLPGSSVHEIFQARLLEWLPLTNPGDIPDLGIELTSLVSPALAGRFFTTCAPWEFPEHVPGIYQIQGVRELKNFYSN